VGPLAAKVASPVVMGAPAEERRGYRWLLDASGGGDMRPSRGLRAVVRNPQARETVMHKPH
jgi:hypothetical protein